MSVTKTVILTTAAMSLCNGLATDTLPVFLSTEKKSLNASVCVTSFPYLSTAVIGSVAAKLSASDVLTSGSNATRV